MRNLANKLPALTVAFWLMKITATTLGETGGDWLSMTMKLGYLESTVIFLTAFVVLLGLQLTARRHHPLIYWGVIIATSTVGTTTSDYMNRTLALGYTKGALLLISLLCVSLALWRWTCGTIEVNVIRSRRAELFYWVTILISNTLGTAAGDFLSDDSGLGFLGSWLLISGVLLLLIAAKSWTNISRVALFWIAFVLTRPFGATFGDVLTKPREDGGLDFGRGSASLILLALLLIIMAVTYRREPQA